MVKFQIFAWTIYWIGFFFGLVNLAVDSDTINTRDVFFERFARVVFWPPFFMYDVFGGLLRAWRKK